MQHLFTPGGEAVLRLHALQQLQQLLLLLCPLTTHHVLITVDNKQGSMHINYVHQLKDKHTYEYYNAICHSMCTRRDHGQKVQYF